MGSARQCFVKRAFFVETSNQTVMFLTISGPPAEVIHMTIEQRRMIDSFLSQGMGYKRIAAQLGILENTVKSRLRWKNTRKYRVFVISVVIIDKCFFTLVY